MKRWKIFAGLVLSFFIFGLTPPASNAQDQPKRGGTLTFSTRKDLTMMNPLVRTSSTDRALRDLMYESLLAMDLKGNIHPNLAESWEVSKDGTVYTFHLRKGVKFHNGQEMTAADVKFAIDYTRNPKNAAYGYSRVALIDRAETVDKHTLKIYLKNASPGFLSLLASIQTFSVIPKESVEEGISKPVSFPPGTGPFKFVEWRPRQRLVLERFDGYWGQKAYIDRLMIRPIPNSTVRFTALRAGDVDIVERAPYEWVKPVNQGKIKGIHIVQAARAGYRHLEFNVAAPPFDNKKLRLAVAHAINKLEILHAAYYGFGEVTDQLYPKGHTWYFDGIPSPERDLEKAKALLKEAGYKGEPITITGRQGEDMETEGATLQFQLKQIGMNIVLRVVDYGAYVAKQRAGDFALRFSGGSYDPDPSPTYGPDFVCPLNLKKRAANTTGYCDKEMDALIRQGEIELNPEKRREIFRKIVTKVVEDIPDIPIGYTPRLFMLGDHVKGFTTNSEGHFRYYGGGLNYTWLDKK